MRLTLVISSLGCGGAERVMSSMANYWVERGREITLLTFSSESPFYSLDSRVNYIPLGIAKKSENVLMAISNNVRRALVLRDAIAKSKSDVVISFMDKVNVITLLATTGLKKPVVVMEQVDPSQYSIGWLWEILRFLTYQKAEQVGVVSKQSVEYFDNLHKDKIFTIPNPAFLQPEDKDLPVLDLQNPCIVAMGRLTFQKGFDILLKAFAKLKDKHTQWKLFILGEGSLRSELEVLSESLSIKHRVSFLGKVKNPYAHLRQANLFVLSSRYEGFPNALCEAMACGLPVVSTDCPTGPKEIIRDGIDGILVANEDVSALSAAMERLMSDEEECQCLANRAVEVTDRFSLEKIMGMWEDLLRQVVKDKQ
ncbi:MAG: glycosyltransferase family 4 protein [Oscillatoria sp. SIO1A7]|nr:glycosyltransferase family 4 protein [Oscillatoria sp. SIO1A7]